MRVDLNLTCSADGCEDDDLGDFSWKASMAEAARSASESACCLRADKTTIKLDHGLGTRGKHVQPSPLNREHSLQGYLPELSR
jgi:hypothetical protein